MLELAGNLKSWATDLDEQTRHQAHETARLPVIAGHVALMADAHMGYGCAIGSVVPTLGALIPSCAGVDLGCGCSAVRTNLVSSDLPDDLSTLLRHISQAVPSGVGNGQDHFVARAARWLDANKPGTKLDDKQAKTALGQLGTLGSGNHFIEVSVDEQDRVWVVLHSGSRGIGNQLAQGHIKIARSIERMATLDKFDPELAWLEENTPEFDAYVADLLWAQSYALENREIMMDKVMHSLFTCVGKGQSVERIACHHNYSEREHHFGQDVWVTRKGAIRARISDLGIIPGSMGTDTYVVEGLGNPDSFCSSSHGAGRKMSRNAARKNLTTESLTQVMSGRMWLSDKANNLVDEHPDAYKDIRDVMAAQTDLVSVRNKLSAVLNYKGT